MRNAFSAARMLLTCSNNTRYMNKKKKKTCRAFKERKKKASRVFFKVCWRAYESSWSEEENLNYFYKGENRKVAKKRGGEEEE